MNFGQYLRFLREKARLQKNELANSVDVTPTYIRSMESGRNPPPEFDLCDKLLKALRADQSERKKFLQLAFEERLKDDVAFLNEINLPNQTNFDKDKEKISKEILVALDDPVALKALLITFQGSEELKRSIKYFIENFPNLSAEKRKAILALCH